MAAIVPISSATWIPEDDLLLKNAIEAGASLQALAKGAVQFSCRFTFCELRDRWHSLLYDPDISAQASARMNELEHCVSNPLSKFNRLDNYKSEESAAKRKIGSIRRQYNAMRKKLRSELFNSNGLGFLDGPNLHDCVGRAGDYQEPITHNNEHGDGNYMLGDGISDHFGLQDSDLDILRCVFPEAVGDIAATTSVNNTGNEFQSGGPNPVVDNHPIRIMKGDVLYDFLEDIPALIREDGMASFQSNIENKDSAHMLTDDSVHNFEKSKGAEEIGPLQDLPHEKLFLPDESETKRMSTFEVNDNPQNLCSGFGGQHINSPDSNGNASFHAMGFSSPLPRLPLWKTMEDMSVPAMPVDITDGDKTIGVEGTQTFCDDSDCRDRSPSGHDVVHSDPLPRNRDNCAFNSAAVSEGEFADISDSLLNFPNEEELLFMDVEGKGKTLKSCSDNIPSLLLGSPKDVHEGVLCDIKSSTSCNIESRSSIVSDTCLGTPSVPCPPELENISSSIHAVQDGVCHIEVDVVPMSVLHPDTVRINDGNIFCTLNMEDPEIPCNDDIFLLIHPITSFPSARQPNTTDSIDPASSADEKDNERGVNLMKKAKDTVLSFSWPPIIRPSLPDPFTGRRPLVGCAVKSEVSDTKCLTLLPGEADNRNPSQCRSTNATTVTTVDGELLEDLTKVEPRVVDNASLSTEMVLHEAGSIKMPIPESSVNPSTSDLDESDSEHDVPYFSDIETMILEMDLGPYNQDPYTSSQVPSYQDEEFKRKLIRLEQCARSSLQRKMVSRGALAVLYGRHLKHYIRKPEVLLGRSTDDVGVDIDLRKEGRANKISRRQAIIKMETDGSFFLKNLGKSSISVNGKEVASGQLLSLSSSCLVEIRGMCFVFEINHKYVKRHVDKDNNQKER